MNSPIFVTNLTGVPFQQSEIPADNGLTEILGDTGLADFANLRSTIPEATIEVVGRALESLDSDMSYNEWVEIAAALRHQFPTDPEATQALELFTDWSSKGDKFVDAEDCKTKWNSLKPTPNGRRPITIRSLFKRARDVGWKQPNFGYPEIYYENRSNRYFAHDAKGIFRSYTQAHVARELAPHETANRPVEELLHRIRSEQCIDLALNISGLPKGLHVVNGHSILVPLGPKYIEPAFGDWSVLRSFWLGMLGEIQFEWFVHWLASSLQSFYQQKWQPAQVVAFVGPPASGKSLTQKLITRLFGGREARVMQGITGDTNFNEDWAESPHLVVEDEFAANNRAIRAQVKEKVKAIAVNEHHRIHPKNGKALMIRPFWRMTVSCNPTFDSLAVLPPLDDSVRNKITLLWTSVHPMPMPAATQDEKAALWDKLDSELPALIYDLLNLTEIPEYLKDPERRFAIKAMHHPAATDELNRLTPEGQLLQTILETLNECDTPVFEGKAKDLHVILFNSGRAGQQTVKSLGKHLMAFCQSHSRTVKLIGESPSHGNDYRIVANDLLQ